MTLPGLREAAVDAPRRSEGILGVLEEAADRIAGAAKAATPPRVAAVYAMLASAGALPVALRGGPPPLSPVQYADFATEVIARLETAGLYEEARPLRRALMSGRLPVYDLARSYLLGDLDFVASVSRELGAAEWLVRILAATVAAGSARAVRALLEERGSLPAPAREAVCPVCGRPLAGGQCSFCLYARR
ncbi:hypothetical protein [Pyrodictium abyssi]|uniref:Uncharacterized protein n=1 Tax=Pyrodictium abyssi TaxID=54256 RepID=A0ABM8IYG4_9CREN|nr:hypothetical protein PABY_15110 [Pyrodictium abyssi]